MTVSILEAKNLTVAIAGKHILDKVNLQVKTGQLLCIVGPNGAGKSSLLQVLSGKIVPQQGEVNLLGKPLPSWVPQLRAQHLALFSQQQDHQYSFKVHELIALGAYPYRHEWPRHKLKALQQQVMTYLQILALAERHYHTLSGGEQQRVQLARVLLQIEMGQGAKERVLLLDEPATHLDIARQYDILQQIKVLIKQCPIAVVMVLHDLNLALAYADQVAILHQGKIAHCGQPREMLKPDNIKSIFGVDLHQLAPAQGAWLVPSEMLI